MLATLEAAGLYALAASTFFIVFELCVWLVPILIILLLVKLVK